MTEPRVINFGCRLNVCESDLIENIARSYGMSDCVIINTCAVTGEAERQVRQCIRKVHKENPSAKIILTGCASEHDPGYYSSMDGVVAIIDNKKKLLDTSYIAFKTQEIQPKKYSQNVRHYVQIQNGCDNCCTYCIVRITRGKSVSFDKNDILDNVRATIDNHPFDGPCEIVLTGVNISSYFDGNYRIADLIQYLLEKEPRLTRLRLSSMDPVDIDSHFIDVFCSDNRVMPHLHMSIQSGDNMTLARMRRRHKRETVIDISNAILSRRPDTIFGADFITGFPTETEGMFENTCKLVVDAKIALTHIFPYSERPDTPAALMPQVEKSLRKNRARRLIKISDDYLDSVLKTKVNTEMNVLAQNEHIGKTDSYLAVYTNDIMIPGRSYRAKIVFADNGVLKANVI